MGTIHALARLAAAAVIVIGVLAIILVAYIYTMNTLDKFNKLTLHQVRSMITENTTINNDIVKYRLVSMINESYMYTRLIVNMAFLGLLLAAIISGLVLGVEALVTSKC